jgi:hypothetical protein
MDPRRCLKIADRIDLLLQDELGLGIDLQRMLTEPLYRRDVLLVCDAHRGHELADLARQYRAAEAEARSAAPVGAGVEAEVAPAATGDEHAASSWSHFGSGFVSSLFDALRPSHPAAPMSAAAMDRAAQADRGQRASEGRSRWPWRR